MSRGDRGSSGQQQAGAGGDGPAVDANPAVTHQAGQGDLTSGGDVDLWGAHLELDAEDQPSPALQGVEVATQIDGSVRLPLAQLLEEAHGRRRLDLPAIDETKT